MEIKESSEAIPLSINSTEGLKQHLFFHQKVNIGDNNYALKLYKNSVGYLLEHQKQQYHISSEGIKGPLNDINTTLLFGPVMMLNLALNQVYCVHASAFTIKNHTFIVMATSGTGKSTIARFMDKKKQAQRIADDILPLTIIDNRLTVLPNFPQLKLTFDEQYNGPQISENIVFLFAQVNEVKTTITPVNHVTSMKKIISHTVASKLFDTDELNGHLQFCHQASQQSQHYMLNYQHSDVSSLNQLYELLYDLC